MLQGSFSVIPLQIEQNLILDFILITDWDNCEAMLDDDFNT